MIIMCPCDTGVIVTVVRLGEQGGTKQGSVRREIVENQFERFKYMLRLIKSMLADSLILGRAASCVQTNGYTCPPPQALILDERSSLAKLSTQYEKTTKKQRRTNGSFCRVQKKNFKY